MRVSSFPLAHASLSSQQTPHVEAQATGRLIAAADIGSNSIHLTLARVGPNGEVDVLRKIKDQARLADSIEPGSGLSTGSMDRAIATLRRFAEIAERVGAEIRATATAAVRGAENRDEFVRRAAEEADLRVEVISGEEEARLAYLGVLHGLPRLRAQQVLCVDVGGGSTEALVGCKGVPYTRHSMPVGALTVTRNLLGPYPVPLARVQAARRHLCDAMRGVIAPILNLGYGPAVATGGTIQRLARISLAMAGGDPGSAAPPIAGYPLSRQALYDVVGCLSEAGTREERLQIPGMDPDRVDSLLGGGLIFEALSSVLGVECWTVATSALRIGVILDTASRHLPISLHLPASGLGAAS